MEPPTGSTGSELLAAFGGVSSPPSPLRGKGVANPAEEEAQPAIPPRGESLPSVADENANMEKPGQSRDAEVAEIIARFRAMGASVPSSPLPATPSKAQAAVAQGKVDLLLNFAPGVALIRLNNPSKRNAISAPMIAQFHDAICTLESLSSDPSSPLVAVIISGAARTFCAGFDLDLAEMIGVGAGDQGMGEEEIKRNGYEMSLAMGDALRRLRKMELISVAAVDGYAIGGGAELATATDFRVLSESCFVRFVQAKLGLTPAWGGATYLSKLVGHRVALRLLASTGRVDPEAAERIGFADRVIAANPADPQDVVVLEALKFLAPIVYHDHHVSAKVPHAPAAIRAMKRALGVTDQDEEAELDRERAVFVQMWGGKEMREAIASRRKHGN